MQQLNIVIDIVQFIYRRLWLWYSINPSLQFFFFFIHILIFILKGKTLNKNRRLQET